MKTDDIYKIIKKIPYSYYYNDKCLNRFEGYDKNLNCSDISADKCLGKIIREKCVRKATTKEIGWLKKQPHVDLNDPENESLRKIIIKLYEMGIFD